MRCNFSPLSVSAWSADPVARGDAELIGAGCATAVNIDSVTVGTSSGEKNPNFSSLSFRQPTPSISSCLRRENHQSPHDSDVKRVKRFTRFYAWSDFMSGLIMYPVASGNYRFDEKLFQFVNIGIGEV